MTRTIKSSKAASLLGNIGEPAAAVPPGVAALGVVFVLFIVYTLFFTETGARMTGRYSNERCYEPNDELEAIGYSDDATLKATEADICGPRTPEFIMERKQEKFGHIFVSIASYRDEACKDTILDLFEKAASPDMITVGVVQQNKDGTKEDCFDTCEVCSRRKQQGSIIVKNIDYMQAKGPAFARWMATELWDGSEFFLQVDSHSKFKQNWDADLVRQFREINDPMAVLSQYPPEKSNIDTLRNSKTTVWNCGAQFGLMDIPEQRAMAGVATDKGAIPSAFAAAGFIFMPGRALYDVPYDPYMVFVFFPEEIVFSARLYTAGYNIYAPTLPVLTHDYSKNPSRPRFWDDIKELTACQSRAVTRAKFLLGMIRFKDVDPAFRAGLSRYGIGKKRTLTQYYTFGGIDVLNKKMVNSCA